MVAERKRGGKKGAVLCSFLSKLFLIVFCTYLRTLFIFHSFSSIVSHLFFEHEGTVGCGREAGGREKGLEGRGTGAENK
jgi:hypothetical protein